MSFERRPDFLNHPILGSMDAYYVTGGNPYLMTAKKLAIGALPFEAIVTIWTDPAKPSDIAINGAVTVVRSSADFRKEVEQRFFEDYTTVTRNEYLEYARDPAYGISLDSLPAIERPDEIWSILRPLEYAVSISEPSDMYPGSEADVSLSFGVAFDNEHDFQIVFKDGKFLEITR